MIQRRLLAGFTFVVLVWLVAGPVIVLLLSTVLATGQRLPFDPRNVPSLDNYASVLSNPVLPSVLLSTAVFSIVALVVGLGISIALAWLVQRTDLPFRNFIYVIIVGPLAIPALLMGIAWVLLLSPNTGLLNLLIRGVGGMAGPGPLNVNTLLGMAFVQGILIVPLSFIMLAAAFGTMDPAHEEAAQMSGARPREVFRRISLTIVLPAIVAVAIYQFVAVVQAFDIPAILGLSSNIRVLSTLIFGSLQPPVGLPNYGSASVYSVLLLAIAIVPLFWYYRLLAQANRYATITGKGYRPRRLRLGRWRYPALIGVGLYLLVAFVLPVSVMLWISVQPFFAPPSLESIGRITLAAYARVFSLPSLQGVIVNTIIVAVVSATSVAVLALLEAWVVIRMRNRLSVLIDFLAFATTAIPGIVIGVSLLFVYLSLGNAVKPSLYGTIWILIIGMVTVTISISTRIMGVAVAQIHRDLEEAAELSGASPFDVLRHVVAPLLRPAVANVWIVVLLAASTNLTISLVLNSSANRLLAVQLYSDWNFGEIASACALGVMLMATSLTISFIFRRAIVRSTEI